MTEYKKIFDLTGRRALISGGGTGIGKLCAEVLGAYGADVVLAARRREKLEETVKELRGQGVSASCVSMDITRSNSIETALKEAVEGGPISILVNSAGVVAKPLLLNLEEDEWDTVLDTNLKGSWLLSKAVAQQMIEADQAGNIINIASILGVGVQKGTGPYMASKAALIHLTRNMALEWARYGINVNAIAPGYIQTDLAEEFLASDPGKAMLKRIPARRLGDLPDLAGAVLLLASGAGAYITGSLITVDGGHSLPQI